MTMSVKMEGENGTKMRILCLHGFRTSGSILKKQISKWNPSILEQFDLEFPDGIFPAGGRSEIEGIFPPPYFEWFKFNKDFTEYEHLEECLDYLCDYITNKGPFHGFLGFSQGAALSALLLGYQAQGKVLKEHPAMKMFISIAGSKFRKPSISEVAYKDTIHVKSVHFIGEKDWLKLPSEELSAAFANPLIIRHPQGHTVPRLDDDAVKKLSKWTMEITQPQHNNDAVSSLTEPENGENLPEINNSSKKKDTGINSTTGEKNGAQDVGSVNGDIKSAPEDKRGAEDIGSVNGEKASNV